LRNYFLNAFIFFTLLCFAASLQAQKFVQFTGSTPSTPHRMIQDRTGYIWMASYLGLIRYDGHTFKTFEHAVYDSTSLSHEIVNDLLEDNDGQLWIATEDGIDRYVSRTESFEHIRFQNSSLRPNNVRRLFQTRDGRYWAATLFSVFQFDPRKGAVSHYPGFDRLGKGVVRQFVEWNRHVWLLTMRGQLYRHDPVSESFHLIDVSEDWIGRIVIDLENNLWILSSRTVIKMNPAGIVSARYQVDHALRDREILDALIVENGIWIGTDDGLFHFDRSDGHMRSIQDYIDRDYLGGRRSIVSLLRDREETVWASIQGSGLYRYSPFRPDFRIVRHDPEHRRSLGSNMIFRIYEDSDSILWIGTSGREINKIDTDGSITRIEWNGFGVRSFADVGDGSLWIGKLRGLERIHRLTGKSMPLQKELDVFQDVAVTEMLSLDQQSWLFGTSRGAAHVTRTNDAVNVKWYRSNSDSNSLSSDLIFTLCRSHRGGVWLGTEAGLDYLDYRAGRVFRTHQGSGFQSGMMTSLWEDSLGRVWVGTYGHGLKVYNPSTGSWRSYTKREGLPNDQIYGILSDGRGGLWLPTNNGLCRFSIHDEQIRWFTEDDGIAGNEFNGGAWCRRRNGSIVLGGPRGLTLFHPERIKTNPYVPGIQIEGIEINGAFVRTDPEECKLSSSENSFEIMYTALSFLVSSKNRFQYRLQGYDAGWVDAKHRRSAPYSNVPPGQYTFQVRGSNNDGVWNMAGAGLRITVLPEVWQTWWFVALVCVVVGASVYGLVAFRVRQLLAVERLRATIAADLHDSVGSGLTDISILTQLVVQHLDQRTRVQVERHLVKIHETTDGIIKSFGDIIWIVNPKRDSLSDLIVRTKDFYQDVFAQLGVQFTTSNLNDLHNLKLKLEKKQQLYLLIKEAIHNSLKHSQCHRIHLDVAVDRIDFKISITDDGQGFRLNGETGNGLKNMRMRASHLGGSLLIQSSPGAGTRVEIQGKV
jgi:ligand-binding sensor domain-containing protein